MKSKTTRGITAVAIFAVLFMGSVLAFGPGYGLGLSDGDQADREAFRVELQTALENGNFETWQALMQSQITEENFVQLQERYDEMTHLQDLREQLRIAIEDGDDETADELRIQIQELMPEMPNAGESFSHFRGKSGMGMNPGNFGDCPFNSAE